MAPQWSREQDSERRRRRAPSQPEGGSTTSSDSNLGCTAADSGAAADGVKRGYCDINWLAVTAAAGGVGAEAVDFATAKRNGAFEEQCTSAVATTAVASIGEDGVVLLPRVLPSTTAVVGKGRAQRTSNDSERTEVKEQVLGQSSCRLGPNDEDRLGAAAATDGCNGMEATTLHEQQRPFPFAADNYLETQGRGSFGASELVACSISASAASAAAGVSARGRPREVAAFADAAGRKKTTVAAAWLEAAAAAAAPNSAARATRIRSHLTTSHRDAPPGSGLDLLRADGPAERQQKRVVRALMEALAATREARHADAALIAAKAAARRNGPPV